MSEPEEIQAKKAKITDFWASGNYRFSTCNPAFNFNSFDEEKVRKFRELEIYSRNRAIKSLRSCTCERSFLQSFCI